MHINEAYEHEPILPYPPEDGCPCPGGCTRTSVQCVDVDAPIVLTPDVTFGDVTVRCQGNPCITCQSAPDGSSCTVIMTQQLCVSIPVHYNVESAPGTPTISCACDPK